MAMVDVAVEWWREERDNLAGTGGILYWEEIPKIPGDAPSKSRGRPEGVK